MSATSTSWQSLQLQSCIVDNLNLLDYPAESPTSVQASAIEAILQDPPRHITVVSGASSGKTLAVCIAIAQRVLNEPLHQHIQALILSKDDSRARNVHHTLDCLLRGTGVNVRLLAPATEEYRHRVDRSEIDSETAAAMTRPLEHAHVIVGCHFAFSAPTMRTYFSRVELLVLDEFADSMWLQTIAKSLLLDLRHVKQALCFSARAPPASLQPVLARLQQPSAITIDLTDGAVGGVPPPRGWKAQMRHYYVDVHGMNKIEALEKLLAALNTGKMDAVVFSNNQSECLALRDHMRGRGHTAFAICSQLMSDEECQFQRNSFINHLGTGTQLMFCGSLWSMVLWKPLVRINFTTPIDVDEYLEHAQFRKTGRFMSANEDGVGEHVDSKHDKIVVTFVQEPQEIVRFDSMRLRLSDTIVFEPLPLNDASEIERMVGTDEHGRARRR